MICKLRKIIVKLLVGLIGRVVLSEPNRLAQNALFQSCMKWLILNVIAPLMRLVGFGNRKRKSVLYVGQAYYNSWYLSRALRDLGWNADLLNWDLNPQSQIHYHGEDFLVDYRERGDVVNYVKFYFESLLNYDVFHFANKGGLQFEKVLP